LAKVHRDQQMQELHQQYPQYGFNQHMGYPTEAHIEALRKFGPCREHRRTFAPVRDLLNV
jgi:ribonuclease HII